MLEATWEPFLFWTAVNADFQGEMWFLNPLCKNTENIQFHKCLRDDGHTVLLTAEWALTAESRYKPSFVMEWRAWPVQDKTLCRGTVGAGGTAAFPEETRVNINTLNMTQHCTRNPHFRLMFPIMQNTTRNNDMGRGTVYGENAQYRKKTSFNLSLDTFSYWVRQ